jgi:hypothetical protein
MIAVVLALMAGRAWLWSGHFHDSYFSIGPYTIRF